MAELTDKLITFAYLRGEIDVPQNIPDAEFDHKIYRAQEMLRMLMGDEFYRDFLAAYKAGPLSMVYQVLYDPYIKQFIAWQTNEFWVVTANYKPTRAGFRVHTEANSEAVSDASMAIIIKDIRQQSQYYKTLFVDYMNGHAADYPLYNRNCGANKLTGNTFHISAVSRKKSCGHRHKCNCNG